jgi:hypothetical protein
MGKFRGLGELEIGLLRHRWSVSNFLPSMLGGSPMPSEMPAGTAFRAWDLTVSSLPPPCTGS